MIENDNTKLINQLVAGYNKATEYTQEAAGIINTIWRKIEQMNVVIEFIVVSSKGARVEF